MIRCALDERVVSKLLDLLDLLCVGHHQSHVSIDGAELHNNWHAVATSTPNTTVAPVATGTTSFTTTPFPVGRRVEALGTCGTRTTLTTAATTAAIAAIRFEHDLAQLVRHHDRPLQILVYCF